MRTFHTLFASLVLALFLPLAGCDVTVEGGEVNIELTGSARITNSIVWDDNGTVVGAELSAVYVGTSVTNALAQVSLGTLGYDDSMVVLDLSEANRWTVVAVDTDGLYYVDESNFISAGIETSIVLTDANFDSVLTAEQSGGNVVVPDTGSAAITNDILWAEGTVTLSAVHVGSSVEDAVASDSLGSIAAGDTLTVGNLSENTTWTLVAVDTDGLYYVATGVSVTAGNTTAVAITADHFDEAVTAAYAGGTVTPGTGTVEILNDIFWLEGPADLTAVHMGATVEDAMASDSLGSLASEMSLTVEGLAAGSNWTVVAIDTDGLYYVATDIEVFADSTTQFSLTENNYDDSLSGGGVLPPTTGSLVVTNDLNWAGVLPDFASTYVTGAEFETTIEGAGTELGFSLSDVPAGDYNVTVTDSLGVTYVADPVPVEADAETTLSMAITYATTGALSLTNMIDNLDNDEVFVVGLFTTAPDGATIDLGDNWLPGGTQLGYSSSVVAVGVPGANYHVIVADWDDNYYLISDVLVVNGAVTEVSVTKEDRDEALTIELNS